ncbi:hypothetical protein M9Y10_025899 [Tritrichomonas musculus]|uniref:Uncharacterized protein n=1 Tax=Tritrichomonas musculus TaxID=1915356 RepID=A0ABR2H816_9EUKA
MTSKEVVAVIPDNVLIQEMLRRQMESLKTRSGNTYESKRLQALIQKQLDKANYQTAIAQGENKRYYRILRPQLEELPELDDEEMCEVYAVIQKQLSSLKMPPLPEMKDRNSSQSIQQYYKVILSICEDIKQVKEKERAELAAMEKQLYELQHQQKDELAQINKILNQKQQELQMLQTDISNEEIKLKEENKQFLLKMRPKKQMLEKLERRSKIAKAEQ